MCMFYPYPPTAGLGSVKVEVEIMCVIKANHSKCVRGFIAKQRRHRKLFADRDQLSGVMGTSLLKLLIAHWDLVPKC